TLAVVIVGLERPRIRAAEPQETERRLEGVVRDPDGQPLAGADVLFVMIAPEARRELFKTGPDGRFSYLLPAGEVRLRIHVQKNPFAPVLRGLRLPDGKVPEELEFRSSRPEPFSAQFVDRAGKPVSHAVIRIESVASDMESHAPNSGQVGLGFHPIETAEV